MAGTGYYGHLAIALGNVRGVPSADVSLEVELKISADGFAAGVAAMILPVCHVQGKAASVVLGQAETIIVQLGFMPAEGRRQAPHRTRARPVESDPDRCAAPRRRSRRRGPDTLCHP